MSFIRKKSAIFIRLFVRQTLFFFLILTFFTFPHPVFAAIPSATLQISGQEHARDMQEESENLKNQIERPINKVKPEQKNSNQTAVESPSVQKVYVRSIKVRGGTLFQFFVNIAKTNQLWGGSLTVDLFPDFIIGAS